MSDPVNHPSHYKDPSGVECIDIVRHKSFNVGNAIKYVFRHNQKGKPIEDLKKALFYIEDEVNHRDSATQYADTTATLQKLIESRSGNEQGFFKAMKLGDLDMAQSCLRAEIIKLEDGQQG